MSAIQISWVQYNQNVYSEKTPDQLNCTTAIESNGNFTKVIGQDNKESLIARPQFSFQYDNIDIYITLTPAKRN